MYGAAEVARLPSGLASAGILYPLPGGEVTAVEGLAFELVTDGNVANRQVVVGLKDGTGAVVYAVAAPAVQTAGLTVVYSFGPLVPLFGTLALGYMGGPFPRTPYADNLDVFVTVAAAAAADHLVNGRLLVCQFERETGFVAAESD